MPTSFCTHINLLLQVKAPATTDAMTDPGVEIRCAQAERRPTVISNVVVVTRLIGAEW